MRILGAGDNVVDRYLDDAVMYPGGNAVNVTVNARRLGAEAAYLGVLGTDLAGQLVHRALFEEGVLLDRVRQQAGPNAYADVRLVDGDRQFIGSHRGVAEFRMDGADFEYAHTFDVVHTAYSGTLMGDVPTIAQGTRVSFDFSYRLGADYRDAILPHLFLATFSGGTLSEGEILDLMARCHAVGAEHVLVTAGDRGAYLLGHDGKAVHWPAQPTEVVDTMGAGDAFIAALLIGLLRDKELTTALEQAAGAAAEACKVRGGWGHPQAILQEGRAK